MSLPDSNGGRLFSAVLTGETGGGANKTSGYLPSELCEAMKNISTLLEERDVDSIPSPGDVRKGIIRCFAEKSGFWNTIFAATRTGDLCTRLKVCDETGKKSSDADAWPWEIVFSQLYNVSLVREDPEAQEGPPVLAFSKIRVRVCSSGEDKDIRDHYDRVIEVLEGMRREVILDKRPDAKVADVLDGLDSAEGPHVLWIVGHGDVHVNQSHIRMADKAIVDSDLATRLERNALEGVKPATRVVIASSCSVIKTLGRNLQKSGVAVVLGFQGKVMADFSAQRLGEFISGIAKNVQIPLPLAVARFLRNVEGAKNYITEKTRKRTGGPDAEELGRALAVMYLSPGVSRMFCDEETVKIAEYLELLADNVKWLTPIPGSPAARSYPASSYVEPMLIEYEKEQKPVQQEEEGDRDRREMSIPFRGLVNEVKGRRGGKRILVCGGPGAGKTELARSVVRELTDVVKHSFYRDGELGEAAIPVFIDFETGQSCPKQASLKDLMAYALCADQVEGAGNVLQAYLDQGRPGLVLVIDALDENMHMGKVLRRGKHIGFHSMLVTCRDRVDVWQNPEWNATFRMPELARNEDFESFVKGHWKRKEPSWRNVSQRIRQDGGLRKMGGTPLLLKLMLRVAEEEGRFEAWSNKAALYQRILDKALQRAWSEKGIEDVPQDPAGWNIFRIFDNALCEVSQMDNFLPEDLFFESAKNNLGPGQMMQIVDLVLRSGIVVSAKKGDQEGYSFFHKNLFEYMAARSLVSNPDVWESIKDHVYDPDWEEVIVLAVSRLVASNRDPMLILRPLGNMPDPLDWAGHWARLFCRCASVSWERPWKEYRKRCLDLVQCSEAVIRRESIKGIYESSQFHDLEIGRTLIERLADDDWQVCDATAEALSSQAHDPDVRQALIEKLAGSDLQVRAAAIRVLSSQTHDPEIRLLLIERLADDDGWGRLAAVMALSSQTHDPEVRRALIQRLADDDCWVRDSTTETLSSQAHVPEIRRVLIERLADDNDTVLAMVVEALASQTHDVEVRRLLMEKLEHDNSWVRKEATYALSSQAHNPEVRLALIQRLTDYDSTVRAAAADTLSSQAHVPEIRRVLIERLADDNDTVLAMVVEALASQTHDVEVRRLLMEKLEHDNSWVRKEATYALSSQAHNPEVRLALIQRLTDYDSTVRAASADTLSSQAHDLEVWQALIERLEGSYSWVHEAATEALSLQVHKPEDRRSLIERLSDDDYSVRAAAADTLSSQAHDLEVRQALIEKLADDKFFVRSTAVNALSSQAHDPEVRQALIERLADGDKEVSSPAARILSAQLHDSEVRQALIQKLDRVYSKERFAISIISSFTEEENVPRELIEAIGKDSLSRKGPILPLLSGAFIWRKTGKKVKIKS